jgi:carboxyl-terminal processing protease
MKALFRSMPMIALGALLGASLTLGEGVLAGKSDTETLPLEELRTFTEIFAKIKNDYVEPVEDKALLESAIRGMLAGLDPHSAYLVAEDYKELQAGTSGEFGGLGIEVGMEDGFVKVIAPIDDTPAMQAGVKSGDLIIRLNDTPVKGMSLSDAVKIMRGRPGTDITLTIVRDGENAPLKITVTRDVIRVTSVKSRLLEQGYGYVRISQFQSRTGDNLRDALAKLEEKSNDRLKGVVLDLRNNPGGVLSAAVSVSDAFLKSGVIVYTEGRLDDAKLKFNAKPTDVLQGAPIVVLVNGGSASASEIVAGALQDHQRAIIMGNKTFGKGSVQTILPMDNGSALKLTTARYFTPKGKSIQATGIIPDIELEDLKVADDKPRTTGRIKEADLARHLKGTGEEKDKSKENEEEKGKNEGADKAADEIPLARRDYAVYEALNLLKGISILQDKSS